MASKIITRSVFIAGDVKEPLLVTSPQSSSASSNSIDGFLQERKRSVWCIKYSFRGWWFFSLPIMHIFTYKSFEWNCVKKSIAAIFAKMLRQSLEMCRKKIIVHEFVEIASWDCRRGSWARVPATTQRRGRRRARRLSCSKGRACWAKIGRAGGAGCVGVRRNCTVTEYNSWKSEPFIKNNCATSSIVNYSTSYDLSDVFIWPIT